MAINLRVHGNSIKLNTSRIVRIANTSCLNSASKMGIWDKIKDFFSSFSKEKAIKHLFSVVHQSESPIQSKGISKLVSFIKLRALASTEHQGKFYINMQQHSFGNSELSFLIDGNLLYKCELDCLETSFIKDLTANNTLSGSTKEEVIAEQFSRYQAAQKVQLNFRRHAQLRLSQAANDVVSLCKRYGEEVTELDSLRQGDILVYNLASNSSRRSKWCIHGFMSQVQHATSSSLITTRLELNSDTVENENVFSRIGEYKFRKVTDVPEHLGRTKGRIACGGYFRLNGVSFEQLQTAFEKVSQNYQKKARTYSRQYNCNNVVYDTLILALKSQNNAL